MIKAEIVAHSVNPQGDELISVLCTFPRIILAEVNAHRMLSKNTSSSRAIPFKKMLQAIEENPFIPIAWQKEHSGMQGTEYLTDSKSIDPIVEKWMRARDYAILQSKNLNQFHGITKQICNRLLEPFMWTTMLITGSKEGWDNFFYLRCPKYGLFSENIPMEFKSKKDLIKYVKQVEAPEFQNQYDSMSELDWLKINKGAAEIHMMQLAECIWDAKNESVPTQLQPGEWHIPFRSRINDTRVLSIVDNFNKLEDRQAEELSKANVKISVAMAARTSYTVVGDEKEIDYNKMIELHDRLLNQEPPHSSPFEHTARCMTPEDYNQYFKGVLTHYETDGNPKYSGWCYNLKGFIPYRYLVDNKIGI